VADDKDVAAIAAGLTEAQRRVILETDPGAVRLIREVHLQTWGALHRKGLASYIRGGGYAFFDLTPLGLAVKSHLEASSG
jgi:hypothetical protein